MQGPLNPTVTITEGSDAVTPGAVLYMLTGGSLASEGEQTFTMPQGTDVALESSASYYVHLEAEAPDETSTPTARLTWTHISDEDAGGAAGWGIDDTLSHQGSPTENWVANPNSSLSIAIQGRVNELEPAPNSPATGGPSIVGTLEVGQTLTAETSGIDDSDGLTSVSYEYRWLRMSCSTREIAGATSSSYELTSADRGKRIKVRVSFLDDAGYSEQLRSNATDRVAGRPDS